MKRLFLILSCVVTSWCMGTPVTDVLTPTAEVESCTRKPKMMIFSSRGGFGHQAASQELEKFFGGTYDVKTIYLIEEGPLKKTDEVRRFSFGLTSSERLYNFLLRNEWTRFLRVVIKQGPDFVRSHRRMMYEAMYEFLLKERPDFIVSVTPVYNWPAIDAAQDLGIPYLLVTLDADLMAWVPGLDEIKHPVFAVTIGYDAPKTRGLLREHKISDAAIHTIGFPIRQSFMQQYDRQELRKKWHIDQHTPTILIMMGGIGTSTALTYARALSKMHMEAHVIVCAGKNEELKKQIESLVPTDPRMKIQALGFTQEIPELMTLSDVLITKGGGVSLYEAMACKIPLICHKIGAQVPWEASNIDFVVESKFGFAITDLGQLEERLHVILQPNVAQNIRTHMEKLHPIRFYSALSALVSQMQAQKYVAFKKREELPEAPWWEAVGSWCSSVIQDVTQTLKGFAQSVKKVLF